MAGGGESDRRREKRAELEVATKGNIAVQALIRMACTVMVYLAFTWSTVILLGGYVSSLHKRDFWCLTVITVIEATSIFNELESQDKLKVGFFNVVSDGILPAAATLLDQLDQLALWPSYLRFMEGGASFALAKILAWPVLCMFNILLLLNLYGPMVCIGLSSWRLWLRDYHGHGADDDGSGANLMRALDFFYTLVLCHGVLYSLLLLVTMSDFSLATGFYKQCKFPRRWGFERVHAYLKDTREIFQRDPAVLAAKERSILSYAVGLLESEWQRDYLRGARMIYLLINDGEDASSIILRSRPKIQRLLDMLGWRSSSSSVEIEIRMLAARIVADLSGGLQLAQFPEAIRCVSSLLETTGQHPLWSNNRYNRPQSDRKEKIVTVKLGPVYFFKIKRSDEGGVGDVDGGGGVKEHNGQEIKDVGCNELIVQGLRILEGLACDAHNCRDICAAPGLVAKVTAPLYSATLIRDIGSSEPWADVTNGSLRAVHRLIHVAPGRSGRRLRREISSNKQAVRNLKSILHLSGNEQLKMRAIEILTELVLGSSVNITKETREDLLRKQLEIFLADEEDQEEQVPEEPAINTIDKNKTIKATAGETLSILSKSEPISRFIVREHGNIVDRLTASMLGEKYNIRYKTLSAEILENLCTHCKELVNEASLQKVIQILTKPKTEASERTTSAPGEEIRENSSQGDDVEKQHPKQTGQRKKTHGKVVKTSDQHANEEEAEMKELQQALLSLTLVIHETLVPVVQDSVAPDAFVDKLKAIVDDNCQEMTPVSLRIIKLCGQIAASIMRSNFCNNDQMKEFVESLSTASKTMAKLESCLLFAGTNCDLQKVARPLLSHLEKELKGLVA